MSRSMLNLENSKQTSVFDGVGCRLRRGMRRKRRGAVYAAQNSVISVFRRLQSIHYELVIQSQVGMIIFEVSKEFLPIAYAKLSSLCRLKLKRLSKDCSTL